MTTTKRTALALIGVQRLPLCKCWLAVRLILAGRTCAGLPAASATVVFGLN